MAAVDLHNSLFVGRPNELAMPPAASHSRSHSTLTLQTLADADWQPSEQLLGGKTPGSEVYKNLLYRQPSHPSEPRQSALYLTGTYPTEEERKGRHEAQVKKRLTRLGKAKILLEIIKGIWATYNIIRYTISFLRFTSSGLLFLPLVLATLVTLSLAFLISATLLGVFQPHLFLSYPTIQRFRTTRTILHGLSSLTLFAPALVNFVFVFIWRKARDVGLRVEGRCGLDVDVIWTSPAERCIPAPAWRIWVALAALRMVLTAILIAAHHLVSWRYHLTRRPSSRSSSRSGTKRPGGYGPRPASGFGTEISTPISQPALAVLNPPPGRASSASPVPTSSLISMRSDPSQTLLPSRSGSSPRRSDETVGVTDRSGTSPRPSRSDLPAPGAEMDEETRRRHQDEELRTIAGLTRSILRNLTRDTMEALDLPTGDPDPGPSTSSQMYHPRADDRVVVLGNRLIRRMSVISERSSEARGASVRRDSVSTQNHNFNGFSHSAPRSWREGSSANSRRGSVGHSPGLTRTHEEEMREGQSYQGCSASGESSGHGDSLSPSSQGRENSSMSHSGHEAQRT